ncbi:MAG TPA: hypothetical protein PKE00_03165 [Planctomycetota bacterium]|nr:hypothetical protein [Planctomycetota bacterium]
MDYRQLPGDPEEARSFSWSAFLDPSRNPASSGEATGPELQESACREPEAPAPDVGPTTAAVPATKPRSVRAKVLRTRASVIALAFLVVGLTFGLPRVFPGLATVWAMVLPIGDGDSDFLDGEIPVDD